MRPIDADEVRKHVFEVYQGNGVELETIMMVPLSAIDNAPTVPLPDFKEGYKQAILDGKTNYSRPEGKWIDGFMSVVYCNKCHSQYRNHAKSYNYCPNCGAEMKGSKNEQYTI